MRSRGCSEDESAHRRRHHHHQKLVYISCIFVTSCCSQIFLLKKNHSIRSIRDSHKANSTMVSQKKKATSSTDDEGAFYHVFFLRRVLQTSSVRATVSEEIESFRVHVILNRVFSNAKIRKSPLFFVASDDSKDHERPNKDSKR